MAFTAVATKLGSDQCKKYFPDVVYSDYEDYNNKDNVWLAVLRVLMTKERLVCSEVGKPQYQLKKDTLLKPEEGEDYTLEMFARNDSCFYTFRYGIWFNFFDNSDINAIEIAHRFDADYKKLGWEFAEDVSKYIDPSGDVSVYLNTAKKGTIVMGPEAKRVRILHMAASCISRLHPWFFAEHPLTEDETALLRTLYDQDNATFIQMTDRFYDAFDFYGKELAETLKGFCSSGIGSQINLIQSHINSWRGDVQQYLSSIRDIQKNIENEQIKLLVLRNKAKKKDEENEIIEFLKANPALTLLRKRDNNLYIGVNCYLNDFNEDMFDTYVKNNDDMSGYIYDESPYSVEETKRLFLAIWEERRFNLRVYCEWRIGSDCLVKPLEHSDMKGRDELRKDRIPQPHIDHWGCVGSYETVFNDLAMERNYIGILSTIIASSSCICWTDSTVVNTLMEDLFDDYDREKCLEDKDGNLYTVEEVIKILRKENKA